MTMHVRTPSEVSPATDARQRSSPRSPEHVDFDLHGLVGVRLVDAAAPEAAAVGRQLGLPPTALDRKPDIIVRFVDRLQQRGRVRFLGLDEAGFTDDGFLLLRGPRKSRVRVQLPLDRIGRECEIVCERGVVAVPMLIPFVNFAALGHGALPLHASSFVNRGKGVVVTGWTKGGKTEALLAFMANGARYVGDEWVYLLPSGDRVVGLPEPIRLWDWHLRQLPGYRANLTSGERRRLGALRMLEAGERALARRRGRLSRGVSRLRPLVERQLHVDADPAALFAESSIALEGPFDRLFFVVSHAVDEVRVEPADPSEVARRMVFSLEYERLDLRAAYLQFRFAFPDVANELLERSEQVQRDALARLLAGKETYAVHHPYPVDLAELYEAMRPHCE
jgi:hypothetical protein